MPETIDLTDDVETPQGKASTVASSSSAAVIDLTVVTPYTPAVARRSPQTADKDGVDLAQVGHELSEALDQYMGDLSEDGGEEDEENWESLGVLHCTLVGIRFYEAVAHPGEYVQLIREPDNPYDRNAVRVDNVRNQKVGHIKKTTAAALAQIIDHPEASEDLELDAVIASEGNDFTMPLRIEVYSKNHEVWFPRVHQMFLSHRERGWRPNGRLAPSKKAKAAVQTTTQKLDWQTAQQDLEDIFDKLTQEQLSNLPPVKLPVSLRTCLLPHLPPAAPSTGPPVARPS